MADRTDHFQRMRGEEAPPVKPDEDAPAFSQEQAAWLRKQFASTPLIGTGGMDTIMEAHTANAKQAGREEVLRLIQSLARG